MINVYFHNTNLIKSKYKKSQIYILFFLVFFLLYGNLLAKESIDDMLYSYQMGRYSIAKKIANDNLNKSEARLTFHLCQVFDNKDRNISKGIAGLKKLYEDKSIDKKVWKEAALSYGKVIQNFQLRGLYSEYKNINVRKVFNNIITTVPKDVNACWAAMALAESYIQNPEKPNEPPDKTKAYQAINLLEDFIHSYKGDKKNTVMLHLFLDSYYINVFRNYRKSYAHLEKAYEIGITKDTLKELVLFRLGRIADIRLKNKIKAKYYYNLFIKQYPYTDRTPVAKRYLKNLR